MVTISLKEAKELYQEASDFWDGTLKFLPEDSPLRRKTVEIFHQDYVSQRTFCCSLVFRTLAKEYMD